MAEVAAYDYSNTANLIEPFDRFWMGDGPFIKDSEHLYGQLWQFKPEVESWTFTINKFRDCVLIRYRVKGSPLFVSWNLMEKVASIENHQKEYVVITLQATGSIGRGSDHVHSIVCHENAPNGVFDFQELLDSLSLSGVNSLVNEFKRKFEPWVRKDAEIMTRKINSIFQSLEKHAYQNVQRTTTAGPQRPMSKQQGATETGARGKSGSRGSARESAEAPPQKRRTVDSETGDTNEKRRRRTEDSRPTTAGSSGSVLTSVQTR